MSKIVVEYSIIHSLSIDGFEYEKKKEKYALSDDELSMEELYEKAENAICKKENVSIEQLKILALMKLG